jgi:hypothetical protein
MENVQEIKEYLQVDTSLRSLTHRAYHGDEKFRVARSRVWALFVAGRNLAYFRSLEATVAKLEEKGLILVRRTIESQVLLTCFAMAPMDPPRSRGPEWGELDYAAHASTVLHALEMCGKDTFRLPVTTWEFVLSACEPYMAATMLETLNIHIRRHDMAPWSCDNPTFFLSYSMVYRLLDNVGEDMPKFDYVYPTATSPSTTSATPPPASPFAPRSRSSSSGMITEDSLVKTV